MRAFLELLRPANVVTALADVLAGFAIAELGNWPALPWLLLSTACLYGGGVVLNDVFDRSIDAIERPERPIPSGRVRPQTAAAFGAILLGAGVVAASRATSTAAVVAGLIAAAVVVYDAAAKRNAVFGPIVMGTCRGLNLVLGISAVASAVAARWNLALLPFFYIWAITAVSRGEVHGRNRRATTFALVAVGGVVAALVIKGMGLDLSRISIDPGGHVIEAAGAVSPLALALSAVLAWRVLGALWRAHQAPGPALVRVAVRTGVLSLVLLDAALAAIYAGIWYALVVLATALVAGGLARLFAVT